jgi:glycosyltransferase involved in cell wall biosynthesis
VRLLGFVPDADLPAVYAGAAVVAYPSLEEGFGLPVLEAMAAGAPVLTSNRSSLPEVGGDAACYVDPTSIAAIRDGLAALLTDPGRRVAMAVAGRNRAAQFSWTATARATLDALESVVT